MFMFNYNRIEYNAYGFMKIQNELLPQLQSRHICSHKSILLAYIKFIIKFSNHFPLHIINFKKQFRNYS